MKKLNIGLVGLGRLGKEYAKNITHLVPNANLLAACSLKQEELDYVKEQLNVQHLYSSYDSMLENKNIDAIAIVTSTDKHADQIIKAVENGFHVFCEKPLSIDIEKCLEVQKVCNKHTDIFVMLGFVRRFDKSYLDAKKKLDSNLIGKPFLIRSQTVDKDTWAPFQIEFCVTGGGMFHDFNPHDIDLTHWYMGSHISKVWSLGGAYRFKEFGEKGDADNTSVMCELLNGTIANISASRVSSFGHHTVTEIVANDGNLKIGDPPNKNFLQIYDNHGVRTECVETFFERFKEAFLYQIEYFVNKTLGDRKTNLTIENATKVTQVAVAMTKSFKENKIIKVNY